MGKNRPLGLERLGGVLTDAPLVVKNLRKRVGE